MIAADEYPRYIQYLRTRPEFIDFSDEEMNILMNNMKVKDFHKGQELFDQTDERSRFYFVVSGLVRPNGRMKVMNLRSIRISSKT